MYVSLIISKILVNFLNENSLYCYFQSSQRWSKENQLFQNINNMDSTETKKIIENMASKMSNDPKQKKNIKNQMENLIDKMKDSSLM